MIREEDLPPLVNLQAEVESYALSSADGSLHHTTPGVDIAISYEITDHEAATKAFDRAVLNIQQQMKEMNKRWGDLGGTNSSGQQLARKMPQMP